MIRDPAFALVQRIYRAIQADYYIAYTVAYLSQQTFFADNLFVIQFQADDGARPEPADQQVPFRQGNRSAV